MKQKKINVVIAIFFILSMSMVFSFPLVSNAASKETAVNKSIKAYFSAMKELNTKKMNEYIYRKKDRFSSSTQMKKESPNMYKYIKKYNKKISFKVQSTKVKGNTAKVKVMVKYVNSEPVAGMYLWIVVADVLNGVDTDAEDYIDKAWKRAEKAALDEIGKLEMKSKTITINMIKDKNRWKIKKMPASLVNIAMADIGDSLEAVTKEMEE